MNLSLQILIMVYEFMKERKEMELFLLHSLIRLIKLKNRIYKINKSQYGIDRDIETLIHNCREYLSNAILWLDKAYFTLKKENKEKEKHNNQIYSNYNNLTKEQKQQLNKLYGKFNERKYKTN